MDAEYFDLPGAAPRAPAADAASNARDQDGPFADLWGLGLLLLTCS